MIGRVRLTLTATSVFVVAIVVVALLFAAYFAAERTINRNADHELARAAELMGHGAFRAIALAEASQFGPGGIPVEPQFVQPIPAEQWAPIEAIPFLQRRNGGVNVVIVGYDGKPLFRANEMPSYLPASVQVGYALKGKDSMFTVAHDGTEFRVATEPVRNFDGKIIGAVQVAEPRTVQNEVLNTLRNVLLGVGGAGLAFSAVVGYMIAGRAMRPVNVAMERQRAFVADAAHEFRTPLTIISANAEALAMSEEGMSSDDRELLSGIRAESGYMAELIAKLLEMARMDSHAGKLAAAPVDLTAVLDDACSAVERVAAHKDVTLTWPSNAKPVEVRGDRVLLRLVVLSLIDNAIKYNRPGGTVDVSLKTVGNEVQVEVADTGPGIPPEHLSRVFDRFYRVDRARSRETGGAGLGLAIAQRAVEVLKGRLELHSEVGKGTVAIIRLGQHAV